MIIIGLNAPFCLDIVLSLILSGLNVPLCLVEKLHINQPAKKSRVDQGPVKARWLTYCKNTNTKCQSCHGTINTNEVTVVLQMKDRKRITDRNGTDRMVVDERHYHVEHRPPDCSQRNTILAPEHFEKGRGRARLMHTQWAEAQKYHAELPPQ